MVTPLRLLLVLFAALLAGLAFLWVGPDGQPRPIVWQAPQAVAPAIPDVAQLPQASLTPPEQLLARPVFTPDRKPPPPPPPPKAEPPPDPMASVRLLGLIGGEAGGVIAQVEGAVRRVKINENIGPWKLDEVSGRAATFSREGETRQLTLAYASLGVAPALPSATPTAGAARPAGGTASAPNTPDRRLEAIQERQRRLAEIRARAGMNATP